MPKRPFSNGTELMMFQERWCDRCKHDEDCEIMLRVMLDEPTPEIVVKGSFADRCTEFVEASSNAPTR